MKDFVFITGNQNKADYLKRWIGHPVEHQKIDLDEIQSLDLREVAEHKARQAYDIAQRPVLVEDVALSLTATGRLPGTFIKWFIEEMGNQGLAELAHRLDSQEVVATIVYAYYDGQQMRLFDGEMRGAIASTEQGDGGFGFDKIFISEGFDKTRAQMTEEEYVATSYRSQALQKFKDFCKGA
jgi:inosine triphosphate pyrophosphatase